MRLALSGIHYPLSAIRYPHTAVSYPPSAFRLLLGFVPLCLGPVATKGGRLIS
jgi:hypothetical protein